MVILFLLIALVLFLVAMFGPASRFNLVAAGLASVTLALLWPHLAPLFG